jgi:ADP-heptose:LPS heptosyltransferase
VEEMQSKLIVKHILVIRFRRIGDAVLATSICSSLRQTFPDAQIDYVLNDNIASLYEGHPDVDRVIGFSDADNKSLFRFAAKARQIMREKRYDIIIDTRSTARTLLFSLFSLATPYRIGAYKSYSALIHNYRIHNHDDKRQDMVQKDLMLLQPLEQIKAVTYCPEFRLYVSEAERHSYRAYMKSKGIDFSRPIIVAAVTARQVHKVWEKARMRQVLEKIIDKYNAQIIFNFAGEREAAYAEELHRDMNHSPAVRTDIHANSLRDLCALMANSDFFFGNEGGPRHIAQALGVTSYAIYPPGPLKSVWLPGAGERYQGLSPEDICSPAELRALNYQQRFDLLTVERVWAGLDPMLQIYLPKATLISSIA